MFEIRFANGSIIVLLQMMVGNAEYRCSCVRYIPKDNAAWMIAVLVGPGLALVIFTSIVVIFGVLYRRRQNKLAVSKNNVYASTDKEDEDGRYSRWLAGDYRKSAIDFNYEGSGYSRELPDDSHDETVV